MGSKRHEEFVKKSENLEYIGCFALTEIRHGKYELFNFYVDIFH